MKKIYDADDGKGILKESKLGDKKGYIDFLVSPFITYDPTERVWPFSKKGGIPSDHKACRNKGYFSDDKIFI